MPQSRQYPSARGSNFTRIPIVFDNLVDAVGYLFQSKLARRFGSGSRTGGAWGGGACGIFGATHLANRSAPNILVSTHLTGPFSWFTFGREMISAHVTNLVVVVKSASRTTPRHYLYDTVQPGIVYV